MISSIPITIGLSTAPVSVSLASVWAITTSSATAVALFGATITLSGSFEVLGGLGWVGAEFIWFSLASVGKEGMGGGWGASNDFIEGV